MKSKILASTVVDNYCIYIEERYDETGINQGLFLVKENGFDKTEEEMPCEKTAFDIYNVIVNKNNFVKCKRQISSTETEEFFGFLVKVNKEECIFDMYLTADGSKMSVSTVKFPRKIILSIQIGTEEEQEFFDKNVKEYLADI